MLAGPFMIVVLAGFEEPGLVKPAQVFSARSTQASIPSSDL